MARPERNDVDYFPHEVHHGKGMFIIEGEFGNDGYAVWFKLLEQLGQAKRHFIDFKKTGQARYLAVLFKVPIERLHKIIECMVDLEVIDPELWNKHQIIYSDKFVDSITDAYRNRRNSPFSFNELKKHLGVIPAQETSKAAQETPKPAQETTKKPRGTIGDLLKSFEDDYSYLKDPKFKELMVLHMKGNKASTKTEKAIAMRLNKMHEFTLAESIQGLMAAIEGGYQGVFPKKGSENRNQSFRQQDQKNYESTKAELQSELRVSEANSE